MRPEIDEEKVARYLAGQPDLAAAFLFGSFARDQARPDSDVDTSVLFAADGRDTPDRFERCLEIEIALQDVVERTVQVVDLGASSLLLQRQVRKYGRMLLERDPRCRATFEVASRRLFFDLEPVRRCRQAAVLAELGGEGPS